MEGGLSANDIKSKVNDLLTLAPDTVNIAKTTTSGGFDLTVTFNSNRGQCSLTDLEDSFSHFEGVK